MVRPRTLLSRRTSAALALAALALGGGGAVVALHRGDAAEVPASSAPYRITYRVEQGSSGPSTTEVLEVDPGRASRRLLPSGGSATTRRGVFDRAGDGTWRQLAVVAPGEAGHELQLTAPLAWAETAGRTERDGSGEVAGIACTWWLTARPLDVGTFAPATAVDRVRSCVDERGRLLADEWHVDGRDLLRRTATEVEALRAVDAFDGANPDEIDPRLVTTVVEERAEPTAELVRPVAPPGASLAAAVRTVHVDPGSTTPVRRTERAVYVDPDGRVTTIEQIRSAEPRELRGDVDVGLGSLGTGRISGTAGGLVVEAGVGGGVVRVRSGLPYDVVVAWLSALEVAQP